jgi:hypothetical protein
MGWLQLNAFFKRNFGLDFKPYEMGMQVLFGMDSQISEEKAIW